MSIVKLSFTLKNYEINLLSFYLTDPVIFGRILKHALFFFACLRLKMCLSWLFRPKICLASNFAFANCFLHILSDCSFYWFLKKTNWCFFYCLGDTKTQIYNTDNFNKFISYEIQMHEYTVLTLTLHSLVTWHSSFY